MNPRAILIWSLSTLVAVVADVNPITRILLLLAALNVSFAIRSPDSGSLRSLRFVAFGGLVAFLISALLDHSGTHVLARLPHGIPGIGGNLTLEACAFGLVTACGLAAALIAAMPLATALEPLDIVDCLPRQLQRTGAIVSLGLGLIPRVAKASAAITEAQTMRGYAPRKLRRAGDVVVPTILAAVEDSFVVAQAMEARGFGATTRTRWRPNPWTRSAAVCAGAACVAAILVVASRLLGWSQDWFPFPSWTTPPVEIVGVLAAVLCVLPALVKSK